ncbi:MAG: OpgC domain-containing protein, partial [Roseiarcus sp.]
MSQAGTYIRRKRIPEIDFWRGFALIVILVDHVPWSGLDYLTPQNFGFSDAAEAFVFLSGLSASLAYAPTLQKAGFGRLVNRCATRAAKLYLVQIAMVACSIAIPLAAAKVVGDEGVALGWG